MKKASWGRFGSVLFLTIFLMAIFQMRAEAATFDPKAKWMTITTPHFKIHYAERTEDVAKRAAEIFEEIYPKVTEKWNWRPWGQTQVMLLDNTDDSNGMAAVLPYNWMILYIVPPEPDSSLAHYDDWLRMLIIHEYTHIVQLDAYGGAWIPFRLLLQKTVSPSGIDPTWMREGIAQYGETYFTGGGRGKGSYSEMVVRTSILEGTFPPIDVADGLSWKPPGYETAYIYGVMFVSWLIDTYGEDKFLELDRRIRSSLLLAMINHQSRNVYGKTLYELWREWQQALAKKYEGSTEKIKVKGLTEFQELVPSKHDEQYFKPAVSPDGTRLVYVAKSPYGPTEIRLMNLRDGSVEVLKKKQAADDFSWSPDGTKIVYSAMGSYKRYYEYNDLWLCDLSKEKKRITQLTKGKRARDPDFMPDGRTVIFVKGENGTDELAKINIEDKEKTVQTLLGDPGNFTQFTNPRVSPDGRYFVVSMWGPEDGWRIYRYDIDAKNQKRLTRSKGLVIEGRPEWSPDGRYVIFSSDGTGISNIYRVSAQGGDEEQLTNVLTGVFQPAFINASTVVVQKYHSKGFELVTFNVGAPGERGVAEAKTIGAAKPKGTSPKAQKKNKIDGPAIGVAGVPGGDSGVVCQGCTARGVLPPPSMSPGFKSDKYVAFGRSLFLPRFIIPNVMYADDALFASLFTGGMDPLRWHRWLADVTYRSDANFLGFDFDYTYSRFRPNLGFGLSDYAVNFGNIGFRNKKGELVDVVHFFEHRRGVYAYLSVPIRRQAVALAYYYEKHMPETHITPAEERALSLGVFAGFRLQYVYGDAENYAASISPESGRQIKMFGSITNRHLGSGPKNEQIVYAGDWREYIKLPGRNVIALRAGGGITWGDKLVQGTFGMGGAVGEGSLATSGSYTYFPFRGLPVSALIGTRAMLFSAEYRFPMIDILRGLGTVPFFFKDISGAVLVDYGNAWNAHQDGCDKFSTFFSEFLMSTGVELRGDFYIGHGLPVQGRIGYAIVVVNRDRIAWLKDPILGDSIRNGMFILTLGTSF